MKDLLRLLILTAILLTSVACGSGGIDNGVSPQLQDNPSFEDNDGGIPEDIDKR